MAIYTEYIVWRRNCPQSGYGGGWAATSHTLKARTDSEATSKLRRMFANCGFHSMQLVALPRGLKPK